MRSRVMTDNTNSETQNVSPAMSDETVEKIQNPPDRKPSSEKQWRDLFFEPQDALALAAFRILWGMMLMYEMYLFSRNNFAKMQMHYYGSEYRMPFENFEWMEKPKRENMEILIQLGFVSALGITTGCMYRTSTIAFVCIFSFMFLLEAAHYLNHFYLLIIITFTMIFVDANARWSVDCNISPKRYFRSHVPAWMTRVFVELLVIVYTWATIVKLNEDWLRAEPLRHWLHPKSVEAGPWVSSLLEKWYMAYVFSYGGIMIDMLQPLLFKQSGWLFAIGFGLSFVFHFTNKVLMNIGLFPFMCIILSTLCLRDGWVRYLGGSEIDVNEDAKIECRLHKKSNNYVPSGSNLYRDGLSWSQVCVVFLLCCWIVFHIVFPARYMLHTTRTQQPWNEIDHNFSWRMKLRTKNCDGFFFAEFENKTRKIINPFENHYMSWRQYEKSICDPWHIRYMARVLAKRVQDVHSEKQPPRVYTNVTCSLNYRYPMPFVSEDVDLTSSEVDGPVSSWVIPIPPLSPQYKDQYPWNWNWTAIYHGDADMQKMHIQWLYGKKV